MRKTRNYRARPRQPWQPQKENREKKTRQAWRVLVFIPTTTTTESGFMNIFKKGKEASTGRADSASATAAAASPVSTPLDMPKPSGAPKIFVRRWKWRRRPKPRSRKRLRSPRRPWKGRRRRRRKRRGAGWREAQTPQKDVAQEEIKTVGGRKGGGTEKTKRRSFRKRK